jgi:hypothetical protein
MPLRQGRTANYLLLKKRVVRILKPQNPKDSSSTRLAEICESGGKGSNLRRVTPLDLQSRAIDHSATSGYIRIISDL